MRFKCEKAWLPCPLFSSFEKEVALAVVPSLSFPHLLLRYLDEGEETRRIEVGEVGERHEWRSHDVCLLAAASTDEIQELNLRKDEEGWGLEIGD